ncbi:MAG: LysR family transcriptional regulator [Myxococcales bacterium]|nr:LysR family transcriptional regulator [Myxococcales bacterium]
MAPIDALQLFVEVFEKRSFTAAARALGLDPSVVSRRIRRLEDTLGTPLFRRTTRAFDATADGQSFYERVAPALAQIREAELELGSPEGHLRGPLRVAAPAALGRARVAPVAHAFARRHPDVTLELLFSDRRVDLVREGVDLAVRVGTPSDPGQIVRRLGLSEQWVVASAAYLAEHPLGASLAGQKVVLRIEDGQLIDLRAYLAPEQQAGVEVALVTDDLQAVADAVKADLGIAGLPRWLVERDVAAGTLVRLPLGPTDLRIPIYAVLVHGRRATKRTRALVDALSEALG